MEELYGEKYFHCLLLVGSINSLIQLTGILTEVKWLRDSIHYLINL